MYGLLTMSKVSKYFIFFFAFIFTLLCSMVFSFIFLTSYTLDGVEYSRNNLFDYYFLTPSIIKTTPYISDKAIYYSQGDDNYGFTRDKVTWEDVIDTVAARNKLEIYLTNQGVQLNSDNNKEEKFLIVSFEHTISLEIINYTR